MTTPMPAPGTKMVRSKDIAALMTCSICVKILRNATTISECLHTFCKKCIIKRIVEEDLKNCPVCNTDLGCSPLEKLRPDHNMQSLVEKIFSSFKKSAKELPEASERKVERPQIEAEENKESNLPSIPMPSRRKERSLSSLVAAPEVPNDQSLVAGRRKSVARKSRNFVCNEDPTSKVDNCPQSSSAPMGLRKVVRDKKQLSSSTTHQSSKQQLPNEGKRQSEPLDGMMTNLWKPLNCLVEAADTTKASKPRSVGIVFKSPPPVTIHQDKANFPKGKGKGKACITNISSSSDSEDDHEAEERRATLVPSVPVKLKRTPRGKQKREETSQGLRLISPQDVVDATSNDQREKRLTSIWLSLVASYNREGALSLPQIPSCYLRIKDIHLPILFIKKYLARKLDLDSEDEVEIELHGHPLPSGLELCNLVDLWSQTTASSERITTSVGSSAKDFVMVLSYSRKMN